MEIVPGCNSEKRQGRGRASWSTTPELFNTPQSFSCRKGKERKRRGKGEMGFFFARDKRHICPKEKQISEKE